MEGFELHTLFVDPRAALLQGGGVFKFRIKGEEMQLYLLALNRLLRIKHILNQLAVTRSCRVDADDALWLVLTLLVGSLLFLILLIAVRLRSCCGR